MTSPRAMDAVALSLLSTAFVAVALFAVVFSQKRAQLPAKVGVMTFHLSSRGELRLWNQPIRPQDVPALLERAKHHSAGKNGLVVRLIPDPHVPWGVTHTMLARLRPDSPGTWTLQLQLP